MSDDELDAVIGRYEEEFGIPVTDALIKEPSKLVSMILSAFPVLEGKISANLDDHP